MSPEPDIDGRDRPGLGRDLAQWRARRTSCSRDVAPRRRRAHDDLHVAGARAHAPVLVCVGADQQSYEAVVPATIMMNKATATTERHQTITWGAAQLGIGQGVLDAVADGLLAADHETIVFVAIWIDAAADDETAVREAGRAAMRARSATRSAGPSAAAIERLVGERDALANPFYGGE